MSRIPLYTNIENLAEVFSWERDSQNFANVSQMLKRESEIIFCESEDEAFNNPLFLELAKDLTEGNLRFDYRDEKETFLGSKFKTNLQELFLNKRTIFWSNDNDRIELAKKKNGLLLAGVGEELDVFNKLNLNRDIYSGNKLLTIGKNFTSYESLADYILPFSELIINEPYLFMPEDINYKLEDYQKRNFEKLIHQLFIGVTNKVNIVICTTIHEQRKEKSDWWSREDESFDKLFNYCNSFLKSVLGGNRYKLWLVISPNNRMGRHDRFIITNYQYIDSPSGFAFFDDRGNFINRGDSMHIYSILYDDARKTHIPEIINKLQENVIDRVKDYNSDRVYGIENGNSYFLKFI